MEDYLVPGGQAQAEYIEKKSRFIGQVFPITTEQEAKATIERVRRQHYDARHNCWCYILKSGQKRYSDDGEPQGTAGQPMLNVLDRERVVDVLCVVTRYFGGVLLGAGGLTRAYAKSAKDALDAAGKARMRLWSAVTVDCPYPMSRAPEAARRRPRRHGGGHRLRRGGEHPHPAAAGECGGL